MFVLGIDSSTQSTKALVVDAEDGSLVAEGRASHPPHSEIDPEVWWRACGEAVRQAVSEAPAPVEAVAVAGQQHGMVALDSTGAVLRDALLWNDTRSAPQARRLTERHGAASLAERTGLVPVASFTLTKLAWLAENEPENAGRLDRVLLPHDWLTWRLSGRPDRAVTDRGDASGTGYFSPSSGEWSPELCEEVLPGAAPRLPEVLSPAQVAGEVTEIEELRGATLGPGTGDNMAAALGLGVEPGDVVVSVGTSGTVFAGTERPCADPTGNVAGFCDATGRYLPLVATLNAARVLDSTANMLGIDLDGLSELALRAAPGAEGLTLLPYLDGERTPDLPEATGTLTGMRTANLTPENVARAAVEGMLCGLADGIDALREVGVAVRRVLLIGGAAESAAVRAIAPTLFGVDVQVPEPAEYVALGAARQAAWVANGTDQPPKWPLRCESYEARDVARGSEIRETYRRAVRRMHG
ncbi:xylulokinase [Actinopolyspora erythraea]|uniref:Xylulose kinase n=1 Tax=Actinopolyspora erythraea TaxID=414996 RepID=A0A099D844_9ACTN|nr:xylulokinase [Actinopolyspora erythraea]ASU78332.1 xylulokinase [Actinopolyspora erythraea]KGI81977.1 xylulose kinase [Actinopolyspora erythraea]